MLNQTVIYSAIILSHFNSAINPLLYAYHLKDFRGALSRLFHCSSQPESLYRPSLISQHQQRMSDHHYYLSKRTFEARTCKDSNDLPTWKKEISHEKDQEVVYDSNDSKKTNSFLDILPISPFENYPNISTNNDSCMEKFTSIVRRRSSQSNKSNKMIFFITDRGNSVMCEHQRSSLYAIVKRNLEKSDSI